MKPQKFYTITDADTTFTNSRSKRFYNKQDAINEATNRVNNGAKGVYILESIALVQRKQQPVEVISV